MTDVFYDLETTGFNTKWCAIHEIGLYCPALNKELSIKVRPFPGAILYPTALAVSGVTAEQIKAYPEEAVGKEQFFEFMGNVSRETGESIKLVGWNIRQFDNPFLRQWFERLGVPDWAYDLAFNCFDVLMDVRSRGHKPGALSDFARRLGVPVETDKVHGGLYDAKLCSQVYDVIYGRALRT